MLRLVMEESRTSPRFPRGIAPFLAPAALLAYVAMLYGEGLFSASALLAGHDIRYFHASRAFGFGELRAGNLPLWNPGMFSGYPFLANFTSALFYPLHVIYLVLPLAAALNVEIALHSWLLGVFMYAWARNRGLRRAAAFFSAVLALSSGVFVAHLRVGHLSMIDAWAWAPLIFLAADRLLDEDSPSIQTVQNGIPKDPPAAASAHGMLPWLLLGILAVTMQILAGHPQCVYYTAFTLAVYCALRLCFTANRTRKLAALALMGIAPVPLTAVQLFPGLAVASECTRAGGANLSFAASFSFPRENAMRLVAPDFFGSAFNAGMDWMGRSFDHESACYVGVTAIVLALVGLVCATGRQRWLYAAVALLTALLALGAYTPVFRLAYEVVPGFAYFRAPARMLFFTTLFGALLAGMGVQCLLERTKPNAWISVAALAIPAFFALAGMWLARHSEVDLSRLIRPVSAGILLALFLGFRARKRPAVRAVILLGLLELALYAHGNRSLLSIASVEDPAVAGFVAQHPGDYRVLDSPALYVERQARPGIPNMWGSDPIMLDRYAQLVAAAGFPIDLASQDVLPKLDRRIANLLRCRFYIQGDPDAPDIVALGEPYPRFYFVREYQVLPKDRILPALADPRFDPRTAVLLERPPAPKPGIAAHAGPADEVTVLDASTGHVTLDVRLDSPAILVNTDAYSAGWRITPLVAGPQANYEVLPAFHGLRAIPLGAGHHRIRLEYAPAAFTVGVWVSLGAWVAFGAAALACITLYMRNPAAVRTRTAP